jgi:hypothetical protein
MLEQRPSVHRYMVRHVLPDPIHYCSSARRSDLRRPSPTTSARNLRGRLQFCRQHLRYVARDCLDLCDLGYDRRVSDARHFGHVVRGRYTRPRQRPSDLAHPPALGLDGYWGLRGRRWTDVARPMEEQQAN